MDFKQLNSKFKAGKKPKGKLTSLTAKTRHENEIMLEMLKRDIGYLEYLATLIPSESWTEEFRDEWNKEMHKKKQLIKDLKTL